MRPSNISISQPARPKQHQAPTDPTSLVKSVFGLAHRYQHNVRLPGDTMEVVISLGLTTEVEFCTGMRPSDWTAAVHWMCTNMTENAAAAAAVVEHWYPDPHAVLAAYGFTVPGDLDTGTPVGLCVTCDEDAPQRPVHCKLRAVCYAHRVLMPSRWYDATARIIFERPLPGLADMLTDAGPPPGWATRHHRSCRTFRPPTEELHAWHVSPVEVDHAATREMDFKWSMAPLDWPPGDPTQQRQWLAQQALSGWNSLVAHASAIGGRQREFAPPNAWPQALDDCPHASTSVHTETLTACSRAMCATEPLERVLAATDPMPLERDAWQSAVLRAPQNVYVADKTDGIRVRMVLFAGGTVTALLRSGVVVDMTRRWPALGTAVCDASELTRHGPTVLDGELVTNRVDNQLLFVAFDMWMENGTPMGQSPTFVTSQLRLKHVVSVCLGPRLRAAGAPLQVMAKEFVPLREMGAAVAKMRNRGSLVQYDDRHAADTDGLVFVVVDTASRPRWYTFTPPARITVDFSISAPDTSGHAGLLLSSDNCSLVSAGSIQLGTDRLAFMRRMQLDTTVVVRLLQQSVPAPLVEAHYDDTTRAWQFVRFRTDKTCPNSVTQAMDTVTRQINTLTPQELRDAVKSIL